MKDKELTKICNEVALRHDKSKMIEFYWFMTAYEFYDNTEDGDIFIDMRDKETNKVYTIDELYDKFIKEYVK